MFKVHISLLIVFIVSLFILSSDISAENTTNTTSTPTPTSTQTSGTTTCANGPIPGNGACLCNGVSYNTGFCCNGVYSSSTSCSTNAPQCSEGAVPSSGCLCSGYAYISGNCCRTALQSGLVWAGNTPCTQTCPTIAKSVSSSYSGVCCGGSASDCKGTWSGQWATDCQGYVCCIGTAQPLCTGNAYGDGAPSPTPTPTSTPSSIPTCADSDGNGAYQTKGTVTLTYSNGTVETKTDYCDGQTTIDYYCSGSYTGSPSTLIKMEIGKGSYNLGSQCTCYDGACPFYNQTTSTSTPTSLPNYTSTPLSPTPITSVTPTYSPLYPQPNYTLPPKPSLSCNTDQDCDWLITNSCPESAGASWSCGSLSIPIEKVPGTICVQFLSPRPQENCGCVQNTCIAFEKEKPKEPPKKIGNTDVDSTTLLSVVIQIEQLKVKFDFLKSATVKLSRYYNLTENKDQSSRWLKASEMLQSSIDKLDSIKEEIRDKISTFDIQDLRKVKKDIKSVIGTIKEIVKIILAPSASPIPTITQPSAQGQINQTNTSTPTPSPSPIATITEPPKGPVTFSTKSGVYNWHNWNPDLRATINYTGFNITKVEYYLKRLSDNNYFSPAGLIGSPQYRYWASNETIYSRADDDAVRKTKHILLQVPNRSLTEGDYEFGIKFTRQDGVNTEWAKAIYNFKSIPEKHALFKNPVDGQQVKVNTTINIDGQCLGDLPSYRCPQDAPDCDTSTWSIYFREKQTNGNWTEFRYPFLTRKVQLNGTCNYQWTVQQPQDCEMVTTTSSTGTSTSYRCTKAAPPRDAQLRLNIYPSCMASNAPDRQAACIQEQRDTINITIVP